MKPTIVTFVALAAALARGQSEDEGSLGAIRLGSSQAGYLKDLIREFGDSDPAQRRLAVKQVSRAGDAAVPLVLESIRETSNPQIIRSGLLALGEIGSPTAVELLRRQVQTGELREAEQTVAMLLLGQLGPEKALNRIRAAAVLKGPSLLRRAALLALGFQRDLEGISPVLSSLGKEALESRRIVALVAAGVCGNRQSLPEVVPFLEDDAVDVRRAAAFAMAEIADPSVLQPLLDTLKRERDEQVLIAVALALGRQEDQASAAALASLASSQVLDLKAVALVALAARADGAEPVLRTLAGSRDPLLLSEVALAVAAAPERRFGDALSNLLASRHAPVRGAAGLALAAQQSVDQAQAILAWLKKERDRDAQISAVLAAGLLEPPGALEILGGPGFRCADMELLERVSRTLQRNSDPRLLQDRLERELRAGQARLIDRIDDLLRDLVAAGCGLKQISRHVSVPSQKPGDGADGAGDGGGPTGSGSEGIRPDLGGRSRLARIDWRNSSVERDLEAWFREDDYFGSWAERQQRLR